MLQYKILMKQYLVIACIVITSSINCISNVNQEMYKQQMELDWMLADKYAACMRQNSCYILVDEIFRLIRKLETEGLTQQEEKALVYWFKIYDVVRHSEKYLYKLYDYNLAENKK